MNLREAEARIAELELGLEKVLDLFEPTELSYTIQVLYGPDEIYGDEPELIEGLLDKPSSDVIESVEELLWGGHADAEEA